MAVFNFLPNADLRNDGWSLVGSSVTALNEALNNDDDTKYVKAPASKAPGAIQFPIDTSTVPEGAVITSVTVKARLATGAGSAPAGTAPSLTIGVGTTQDTSKYTSRTVYPSGTPSTIEVATLQKDALGFLWDVHRLNFLYLRFWCFIGVFDICRLYKLYCEIKYRVRPVVSITAPNGTVNTPSPTISWTYSQADGDPQLTTEYKIFTAAQVSAVGFNPNSATPVYSNKINGDITSIILPTSINSNTYWVYLRSTSSFKAVSTWASKQFTVAGPTPGVPGVDNVLDPSAAAVIAVVADKEFGSASLSLLDTSNLLSSQEADAESNIDGAAWYGNNCSVSRDSTTAFPGGTTSWKLTATGAGDMTVLSGYQEVEPGTPITVTGQFRAATTARSTNCVIAFYDDQFALVTVAGGTPQNDSTSTWSELNTWTTVPAGAVYAVAGYVITAAGADEVHNIDRLGLMYGTNTPWSDGGYRSRNMLSSWYSTPISGSAQAGESWIGGPGTSTTTSVPVGTGGTANLCNKMTWNGISPSISFRAAGTAFTSPTTGNDYTLNKPAGVAAGDLMVAFVTSSESSGTIVPPVGWTLASTSKVDDATTDTALYVLKRTAGGSEPASWTDGTVTASASRRTAIVVAYVGAADASLQFIADTAAQSSAATPLTLSTPTINNTDPNAWRIAAFAVSDDTSGGTMTANRNAPAAVAQIQYVGSNATTNYYSNNTFVINKPTGVVTGDLMIASVSTAGATTLTPPSGWTLVQHDSSGGGSQSTDTSVTSAVMYRYATASEPASWTGSRSPSGYQAYASTTVAYRNVHATVPFIAESGMSGGSIGTVSTPSVTNTNSLAWRVSMFSASTQNGVATNFTTTEAIERIKSNNQYSGATVVNALFDSNTSIGTGATSRTASLSAPYYNHATWIGILNPSATAPSAVADETARGVAAIGSSNPYMTTRVFDSNGVSPTGLLGMTGIWATGGGTDKNSMAGWFGIIKPAAAVVEGYASATMATQVDLTGINVDEIYDTEHITAVTSFIGSTNGTPYLTVNFYRANQLIDSLTAEGTSFGTGVWVKSAATFPVPEGTTRVTLGVSVSDRSIGDIVYWDRSSLAYGTDTSYRQGTSRTTHPVWSKPQIQYADDDGTGYTEWKDLTGQITNPAYFEALSGQAYYVDHTVIPLTNRKYRARTKAIGLNGDTFVSDWGPESFEFQFEAQNWWLKDISDPSLNMELSVKWDSIQITRTNTGTVFQPIGNELPVVLTEGFKGETFSLDLIPVNHDDWVKLARMLESGKTLFLQSDVDQAWFVRPIGDLSASILPTNQRRSNPFRAIKVGFVQVEPDM